MQALDVIELFDSIRPNSFDMSLKKEWLWSIESQILEFISAHRDISMPQSFVEENPQLCLDVCWRDIYLYYLIAMADMTNAEFKLYNISSMYSNELLDKWRRSYRAKNAPKCTLNIKL